MNDKIYDGAEVTICSIDNGFNVECNCTGMSVDVIDIDDAMAIRKICDEMINSGIADTIKKTDSFYKDEFCVQFKGDYSSDITTIPKEFDVLIYDTAEDILNKSWNCAFECGEDLEGDHGFFDGHGSEIIMSNSEVLENIKEFGMWGFVGDKKDIHIWIDNGVIDDINLMAFISHEVGHLQRPHRRDTMAEEMKAEHYSDMARCAHVICKAIKERHLP